MFRGLPRRGLWGSFVYTRACNPFGRHLMPFLAVRRFLLVIPLCAVLFGAGCATDSASRQQQRLARFSAQSLYDQGREAMRASDFALAVEIYEALAARYPFADETRQARLEVIYAYYRLGEKESAKDAADTFIRENPSHPRIDYAWYLQGLIDFERTPNVVERWMNIDMAEKPPQTARDSFESLRRVVVEFPTSIYASDARQRMIYLRNRLADYEMNVAAHYIERGAWVAAAQRARQAIEQYDGAPAVKDALRVMILCYKKLDYDDLAANTEKVFQENFPGESTQLDLKATRWWQFWHTS